MKRLKTVGATLIVGVLLVATSGCGKEEGPAEHAGKEIDKAMEQTSEYAKNAADQIGNQLDQAGEHIQDAAKDDNGGN